MSEFERGARVRIVGGKGKGVAGEVFWWGKSKFGDGMRAGVTGDDGEKYWVDADDLAAESATSAPEPVSGNHLAGVKIVLTGDFDSYSRDEATAVLEGLGADVTGSVSGKTMAVIVGRNPGSKVSKAKSRGVPLLDEQQLLALVGGATLQDVLEAVAESAPERVVIEKPWVAPHPRNGTTTTYWEGTGQVREVGEYVNGLREGAWKEFWPNGQQKQDYEWSAGLKHGHELDWAENGTKVCDGRNERHLRAGTWTWWHDNGVPYQKTSYDEAGKQHGPYEWNLEDGSPRARGEYWHGQRHGNWEWHHEPNHERMIRGHHRGSNHGEDAGWYPGGQLAYRRFFHRGQKHGQEQTFHPDGAPQFKGTWEYGTAVGEHHQWDADGNLTTTVWENGFEVGTLPTEKKLAGLVKKLQKAKDEYAKSDAIGNVAEWSQRPALVYDLWKSGLYDVPKDPDLWELLGDFGAFGGSDVVEFLETATNENVWGGHLPYWARTMDRLVMKVYARDPEPIEAGWKELPDLNRKGVAFVRARFGKDTDGLLSDEMGALAKRHAENYGLEDRVLWPTEEGFVEEQHLFEGPERTPTALFDEFIGLFGTHEQWTAALKPYALREAVETVSRVSFPLFRPVIEAASIDEMITLCSGISLDGNTHEYIHKALWEWRGDDGAAMTEIALGIEDDGLRKWPAVCAAILKLHSEGKEIGQELVDAFLLDAESPTYSSQWSQPMGLPEEFRANPFYVAGAVPIGIGDSVPRTKRIHEALRLLSEDQIREIFERYLASDYRKTYPAQFLYLVDDAELWERVIELAEKDSYGHQPRVTWGFGDIGLKVVPLLEAAIERATNKDFKAGWSQAIICALTRAIVDGEEIPEEYDRYVRFDVAPKDYDYQFLRPFLQRLVHLLPQPRAEKILLEGLESKYYWRALRGVASHPTEKVLAKAFDRLLELESTMDYEQRQDLVFALKGLPNPAAWVEWVLRSGGGSGCRDALKDAIGWQAFEKLEAAMAADGVEKPAELDAIDKIVARVAEAASDGEELYLLRRLDERSGEDLNVIGGPAPGVGAERWPMRDDEPMAHLFTLDLVTMPRLAERYDARSISVFCHQPDYNEAWEPGNDWTAVVFSTQAEIDAATAPPDEVPSAPEGFFEVVTVRADLTDSNVRSEIYKAPARVMGDPIWLQGEEHWGDFVMQFDEAFSHMNLGDSGVMYVFGDTAFWQCY